MLSFSLISRWAWPSMMVIGVRNSWDAMETKLRCCSANRCSCANCSASIAAWRASMRWLSISAMALLRNTTVACAISPISSARPVSGTSISVSLAASLRMRSASCNSGPEMDRLI